MGQGGSRAGPGGPGKKQGPGGEPPKKKKFEVKPLTRIKRKKKGPSTGSKLPKVYPTVKCKLREMKLERIKDFLLMEREFIQNQETLKPKAERETAGACVGALGVGSARVRVFVGASARACEGGGFDASARDARRELFFAAVARRRAARGHLLTSRLSRSLFRSLLASSARVRALLLYLRLRSLYIMY